MNGELLCSRCDERRNGPEALWEAVKEAKDEHIRLAARFDELNRDVVAQTHGIPYPDSIRQIEVLGRQVRQAFQKYHRAMAEYTDALKRR